MPARARFRGFTRGDVQLAIVLVSTLLVALASVATTDALGREQLRAGQPALRSSIPAATVAAVDAEPLD